MKNPPRAIQVSQAYVEYRLDLDNEGFYRTIVRHPYVESPSIWPKHLVNPQEYFDLYIDPFWINNIHMLGKTFDRFLPFYKEGHTLLQYQVLGQVPSEEIEHLDELFEAMLRAYRQFNEQGSSPESAQRVVHAEHNFNLAWKEFGQTHTLLTPESWKAQADFTEQSYHAPFQWSNEKE